MNFYALLLSYNFIMDRNILITGATPGGIGYEAAKTLKGRGYNVIVTAKQDEVLRELERQGLDVLYLDYRDSESIQKAFADVMEKFGGNLYALFNNGAYGQPGALEDITTEVLREQFEANFFGWHTLTRLALPGMLKTGEGRIIQHGSVLGLVALRFRGAYNATKFALEGYSDTLRLELGGSGVYVVTLNTGPITSCFRENAKESFLKHVDIKNSRFVSLYEKQLKEKFGDNIKEESGFTRRPDVVVKKLILALESQHPKPRYTITEATYLMELFRRMLPTSVLDKLLLKVE